MTQKRDARILDDLDNIKYNAYDTKEVITRLVQARATATIALKCTYNETERQYWWKVYEIIHNAMLEIIYLDKELSN